MSTIKNEEVKSLAKAAEPVKAEAKTETVAVKKEAPAVKKPAAKKAAPAAKKPAAKKAPAKKEAAPAAKKEATAAKKAAPAAKKTAAKKPAAKKAAKAAPAKIVEPKKFIIQNQADQSISYTDIVKKVNKAYKENIKSLEIYVKSSENKAYYVINGDVTGSVDLY